MNEQFVAGTITVPSRSEIIKPIIKEFRDIGIRHSIYVDTKYKGQKWNISRMMLDMCLNKKDKNIIITTDDIEFKANWFEKCNEVLNNSDYDVITLFTNREYYADDVCGIHKATHNWWMYDQFVLFRAGILNIQWFDDFMAFCNRPNKHRKEINHYDNMIGHFLIEKGYKCGIVRPNFVKLQNVKSTLGHNIVIKE